jgi:hypothetical protein
VPDYDRYLARFYCPLAGGLRGGRTVEKTLAVAIEVPKQVSLQPVGQHAKQEMAGQVKGADAARRRSANEPEGR